ncbi:MAG: hypothetical protein IJA72_02275 [Clostridia bacterium]|nr:hypothetical protein [Clostridia bacterium]
MKKFLIFLVATIVAVCIGMTFYQFAKNDEVIKVNAETIYINYGDKLSLDDIGFSRKEASKDTKINFNAGGDEVTSIIKYDEVTKCYIPTQKGGATTIKISTTNRKYKTLTIDVIVGIGTEENPYYISNESQLFNIGGLYDLGSYFEMVADIDISSPHYPIGLVDGKYKEFTGKFNGMYHTISNLNINECDNAGLFAIMGSNSEVYNLNISNSTINGSFLNAGTVAGICYGTINKVVVENSTISNTRTSSNTGAVVGSLLTDKTTGSTAGILRTGAYTNQSNQITAKGNLGGLTGLLDSAVIHACYTDLSLKNTSGVTGGLVGAIVIDDNTYVRESYSITKIQSTGTCAGNIAGKVSISKTANSIDQELVFVGVYFNKSVNNYPGIGEDAYGFASITNFAINGKTTSELKTKSTYIYYIDTTNDVKYWDKVWSLVDGEYPTLTFVTKFDEIDLEGESSTTTPGNPGQDITNPDIDNPDDITDPNKPSTNVSSISTKEELLNVFQTGNAVSGSYVLSNNINLGGMTWNPVAFSGKFVSDSSTSYTISNFKIDTNNHYSGFFSKLSSATIEGIKFSNVKISNSSTNETVGILVGYISGTATIKNVGVSNSEITASTKYAGVIVGLAGNVVVNIENCTASSSKIGTSALNVGGIVGRVGSSTKIVNCNAKNLTLKGVDRVGGIIAINYGLVSSCSTSGEIASSSTASQVGYFGGIVGLNHGTVINSKNQMNITVYNNSEKTAGIFYYVGGLVGYNLGLVSKSCVYADKFSGSNANAATHIGGLIGYNNKGTLEYCFANIESIGETRANIYVAGISAYNFGGAINGCWVCVKELNGYVVAGLVRVNSNKGTVDSCATVGTTLNNRSTFKGVYTVSFVYDMVSGTVSDCLVKANLTCSYDSGWMAGFAGFMPYSNGVYGTIKTSIADVSFAGNGTKFLDLAEDGLMKKERTTGTITKCVISKDALVSGVIMSEYDNQFIFWGTAEAGSGSNFITATESEMKNIETYLDTKKCNFDIASGDLNSKWYYSEGDIPTPRAIQQAYTGAAG